MKRIIYDYEKPHIVGRAKGSFSKAKIIVAILIFGLLIAAIYVLFFRTSSVTLSCTEFFAVAVKGKEDVNVTAEQIKILGGGGYVDNDSVIVCVYPSKQDAEKVASRYGYTVESLGKFKVKIDYSSDELSNQVAKLCSLPEKIALELYQYVVSLDKGELSEAAALLAIENTLELINENLELTNSLLVDYPKDKLIKDARQALEQISTALSEQNFYSVSSRLKYCLTSVVYINKNLLISIT
ncbi:MAG: hypothetical protein IKC35_02380 [Clostridia bacterium]|nr:hypothetical protein [Clostridia bacterium]